MKKFILIVLITICNLNIFGQKIKEIHLSVMPLSILDFWQPSLRANIRVYPMEKLSVESDFSYGFYQMFYMPKSYINEYYLWQIRPAVNYSYIKSKHLELFVGGEFFYMKVLKNINNGEFDLEEGGGVSFKQADMLKYKIGLDLKLGIDLYLFENLLFELYIGGGYFWRNIVYRNIVDGNYGSYFLQESFIPVPKSGYIETFNFIAGLKIGVRL